MTKSLSKSKRNAAFSKNGGHCAYCGASVDIITMHIDHILPKALGGSNSIENLNPSCQKCNSTKGDRDLDEFRLHMMIKNSKFSGVINFRNWQDLNDRGVIINLPVHLFYFEVKSNEQSGY